MTDSVIGVFADHHDAETAIKALTSGGFDMKTLSVVGKGYHTDEKVTGFYNIGDRVKFWGSRGAFWGGFWGLFFGGMFLTIPIVEGAITVGGLSALGAALYSIGIPKDSIVHYEADLKADNFLVMAHGTAADMARAKEILGNANPLRMDVHAGADTVSQPGRMVHAAD